MLTLLSRVLGFIRDLIIARAFGAGSGTDAFFVAFKIPNFLRRLFAEGAFANAFVPVFTEYKERGDRAALLELVSRVSGTLGAVLLVLTTLAITGAPLLVLLFAPGFSDEPERYQLAREMLGLTFPYIFFISLTALAGGILHSFQRFFAPAFTPVLLNLALISAALWLAPQIDPPVFALAWGVFLAGLIQLAFQLPFLARLGLLPLPRWGGDHPGVRKIVRLMIPGLFGSSVAQINLLLDTVIASFLAAGSVTWLYYADRLVEFPLGLFGVALATVILPKLSADHAKSDPLAFRRTLDWALRLALVIALPSALGLLLLAAPIIATLFQYDAFSATDTTMAATALAAYAVGLPGFLLVKLLAPGYYARQDTATPVKIGVIAMAANMAMNLLFVVPMSLLGYNAPHAGLALATGLAAWLNAGLLLRGLLRAGVFIPAPGWRALFLRVMLATAAMSTALLVIEQNSWSMWDQWQRASQLLIQIATAGTIYLLALVTFGLRPHHLRPAP